jgi:hypothetical protein
MAEKKVIELEVKTDSFKSLKAQLREAQNEVTALSEKFGATSKEAINAAKRAAELKDAIGDAKALTDAYNPDAKFNALSQALSGVLNGFQAFEGALGLIGVESKEVQEQLLKVQSAMALAQGVSGVMESIDSFRTLGAQIKNLTIVQKLLNLAMKANPIGLLIAGITALLAVGYKLVSWWYDSAEATEKANASLDRHTKALEKQEKQLERSSKNLKDANKYQYDYAAAAGASSEQLRKLAIKHQEEELALAKKNLELAKSTYLREQDILASYRANDASEELIERQTEIVKKAREATGKARESLAQEYDDLKGLRRQQKVEIKQEETNADKEAQDRAKNALGKRKEIVKETTKTIVEETRKQGDVTQEQEDFFTQMLVDSEAERDKIRQEAIAKQEEDELMLMQFRGDIYKQDVDNADAAAKQKEDLEKKSLEWSEMNQGQKLELVLKYAQTFSQAMGSLTTLLNANDNERLKNVKKGSKEEEAIKKKMFERDKKLRIVQTVIDTASNVVNSVRNGGGVPAGIPFGVAAAAMGAMQVAAISKAKFEGGGEQVQNPTGGTTGGAVAPSFNIVGNAQATNPLAGLGSSPIKAYVVSGEVTTAQSLDRQKVYSATFG